MERKPWGQLRGEVGYCAKWLSKETIPRHFCVPITQVAKEPDLRLTPSTEKAQGAGSWEAPARICRLQGRQCWWWKFLLRTYQKPGMTRTCFGFWLKEGKRSSPLWEYGMLPWICASLARTSLFWVSEGHGPSVAERVLFSQLSPQAWCTKGGNWRICAWRKQLSLLFISKDKGGNIYFMQRPKERYRQIVSGAISNVVCNSGVRGASRRRALNTGTPKKNRVTWEYGSTP